MFTVINNTGALYPRTISFKHPKAGQPNSAVRVGVCQDPLNSVFLER